MPSNVVSAVHNVVDTSQMVRARPFVNSRAVLCGTEVKCFP